MYIYSLVSSRKLLRRSQWNLIFEVARTVAGRICVSCRRDSEVVIATRLRAGPSRNRGCISSRNRGFLSLSDNTDPLWGPTLLLSLISWGSIPVCEAVGAWSSPLIHLVQRLVLSGATVLHPSQYMVSWPAHGLYLLLSTFCIGRI
jgi:hypothetical protein